MPTAIIVPIAVVMTIIAAVACWRRPHTCPADPIDGNKVATFATGGAWQTKHNDRPMRRAGHKTYLR
eukprot:5417862-Lingulodinium_polyedra.AAC.1